MLLQAALSALIGLAAGGDPWGVYGTGLGPEVGCLMQQLGYEKALTTNKMLPEGSMRRRQVWDALLTGDMTQAGMGNCSGQTATPPAGVARPTPASFSVGGLALFVSGAGGDDRAAGTEKAPVKTAGRALALSRALPKWSNVTIVLRAGIHHLAAPLRLTAQDSGLTLQNYPGEEAWLSGATPLTPQWEPWSAAPEGSNVWKAQLPPSLGKVWGVHELHDPADSRHEHKQSTICLRFMDLF